MPEKDFDEVLERSLVLIGSADRTDRQRIRAVMNGGAAGVQAVFAGQYERPAHGPGSGHGSDPVKAGLGMDLPTANIMYSGLERLAQRVGREPTLKTDMLPIRDTDLARRAGEKRARIVNGWDEMAVMEMQYPQIGRWLPGYGFTLHTIRERKVGKYSFPIAEMRDPYDVYPGTWGVDQQPDDVVVVRHMSRRAIRKAYPELAEKFENAWDKPRRSNRDIPIIGEQRSSWEGNPAAPVEVYEYSCCCGTYVACPELSDLLGHIPNPLESGPAFVMTKRFSFDILQSHFHHVFGLMAMMGKMNILGLIAGEDGVFRETNIAGEMVGKKYKRGRFAVNQFEAGTQITKPTGDQLNQVWQAINVLERQFRVVSNYDVAQDGQSPNSFATGQGIKELGTAADANVREYQLAIRHSVQRIDRKRLEWEEKMHPNQSKRVYYYEGGSKFEETYVPAKDIDGDYRTRRVYGAMATFDESTQIVAGLQLMQARVLDRRTVQENLDGIENIDLINQRIDQDQAKEMMIGALGSRAGTGQDPKADMALVSIMEKPADTTKTLVKLFTPKEPQMSPEEQMLAQGGMPGGPGGMPGGPGGMVAEGGPPPAVQTILAQMESEGGGVQSVGQMS